MTYTAFIKLAASPVLAEKIKRAQFVRISYLSPEGETKRATAQIIPFGSMKETRERIAAGETIGPRRGFVTTDHPLLLRGPKGLALDYHKTGAGRRNLYLANLLSIE
jgi:hypothetical protein